MHMSRILKTVQAGNESTFAKRECDIINQNMSLPKRIIISKILCEIYDKYAYICRTVQRYKIRRKFLSLPT